MVENATTGMPAESCGPLITTGRLLLRPWRYEDREPFAAMNSDPQVMRFFPTALSREQSDNVAARIERHFVEHGYGFWALEIPGVTTFAGFVGLAVVPFESHFTPAIETGWRLAREFWGCGYATEAARAALNYGFECLDLEEIVAFAVKDNRRSTAVMERLGMSHDEADDFDHPHLAEGDPLRRHVLYRAKRG